MTTEPHGWNGPQKHAKSESPDASPAKHLLKEWVPIGSKNYTLSLYNEFKSRIDCFSWAISVSKLIKARDSLHLLVHKNFAVHPPFCSPSSYQFVHNTQSSWLQITIQTRTCGQLLILDLMVFVLASRLLIPNMPVFSRACFETEPLSQCTMRSTLALQLLPLHAKTRTLISKVLVSSISFRSWKKRINWI